MIMELLKPYVLEGLI